MDVRARCKLSTISTNLLWPTLGSFHGHCSGHFQFQWWQWNSRIVRFFSSTVEEFLSFIEFPTQRTSSIKYIMVCLKYRKASLWPICAETTDQMRRRYFVLPDSSLKWHLLSFSTQEFFFIFKIICCYITPNIEYRYKEAEEVLLSFEQSQVNRGALLAQSAPYVAVGYGDASVVQLLLKRLNIDPSTKEQLVDSHFCYWPWAINGSRPFCLARDVFQDHSFVCGSSSTCGHWDTYGNRELLLTADILAMGTICLSRLILPMCRDNQ